MPEPIKVYVDNVSQDLRAALRDDDALVSALTGGVADQTVSERVALAARRDKKRWACIFCAFLSLAVQWNHCQITLDNGPMPWWVYVRAAFWFLLCLVGLPVAVAYVGVHVL